MDEVLIQKLNDIIARLDEVDVSAPPGELYGYQNVLFSMLDPIARRTTGVPYQVLLDEKMHRPDPWTWIKILTWLSPMLKQGQVMSP